MAKPKLQPAEPVTKKKILLVDDHPITREGLRTVINRQPDLIVCGESANAQQAMEAIKKLAPDLVLLDITLPGKSGLELVKDIQAVYPRVSILAISMHDESLYAERMLRAGASGYINKHRPPEELIAAIQKVLNNEVYLSSEESARLLQRMSGKTRGNRSPMEILTDREFEVFQIIGQGKTPKEIASELHLSIRTVSVHYANIRQKLNLPGTSQLIHYAVQTADLETSTGMARPTSSQVHFQHGLDDFTVTGVAIAGQQKSPKRSAAVVTR